ncbi:double-strand break repair helicase AddA [Devosia nitrariae]|uniref:DNA 3'-5' helicase n=1 Tax=Devosia nitrariae TaxID=2071872 RepID=A0ABQ5W814_9HYPH|nr:double-strand break repair helicase AddA [Devosia nitrariae]GLQ56028.1 double-strand break repair helicase AddA [Devosia nitrariae]
MSRSLQVPTDTIANQARAAHPEWSAWVSANAGSGKTHVLTQRVLRLLLADVAPEAILCLTYTKAAAAEMRNRVARVLGEWAILPDVELDRHLEAFGQLVTASLRARARTLFARALETPGGLKIVTIHAFCESVLHRFPLEAGVPFGFTVVEDVERVQMVGAAREAVLAGGLRGDEGSEAVETLFGLMSDFSIGEAIDTALAEGRRLKAVLANRAGAKVNLRRRVRFAGRSSAEIEAEMLAGRLIGSDEIARILDSCPPKRGGNRFEDALAGLDRHAPSLGGWLSAFLTADFTVRARFPSKAFQAADRAMADLALVEANRLAALCAERRTACLVERSDALLDVLAAITGRYEAIKRARALLDFDDLIEKLAALLEDGRYQLWVQYKLDAGIHHILVDESQDTNPEQWRVVEALTREFFVGEGQVARPRTLFSVGDPKQSIYSFQGAEPRLFVEAGRGYGRRALAAQKSFTHIELHTSFRTLRPILDAVDLVCAREDIQNALLAEQKVHHDTARTEAGGMVTLWPPLQQVRPAVPTDEWPLKPVETAEQSAPRQVASRIAREIRGWIDGGRRLANGEAMSADDVMVLVQSRSTLFNEIIRALNAEGLPTPGADRLQVTEHIAVKDLLALADVLTNTGEDLQLAAVLRSPLFDISEDDLFAIAAGRGGKSLWQALAETRVLWGAAAYGELSQWRSRLDFGRPFTFFADILYPQGGLKRFHARLGAEVDDVLAEFLELALAHEQHAQPSLTGFVAAMRGQEVSIKRDLAERGGGVRVMTVHGAKGLEAPVVILADAATKPNGRQTAKPVLIVTDERGPLFIHASAKDDHVDETLALREESEKNLGQEYWRKLYVGMTRAEEALYVTGALTPGKDAKGQVKGTWYEAIETALRPFARIEEDAGGSERALVYPMEVALPRMAGTPAIALSRVAPLTLAELPEPADRPVVRPSSAFAETVPPPVFDTAAQAVRDAEEARRSGIALHALLQHLPRVPPESRRAVAGKALVTLLPDHEFVHKGLIERAISILSRPDLAHLFQADSRAEVPFLLDLRRGGKPVRLAGRIDRLVVDDNRVLVVDYKSDATLPGAPESVPGNYLTQLGLYALVAGQLFPDRTVSAAILWTSMESLMNLPRDLLTARTADFTLG